MGKFRKLVVYLDQNFLSDMSKDGHKKGLRPEFKQIYKLLRQGVIDEKLVVPGSHLHDIESSVLPDLKERIKSTQHQLGLVRLIRPEEVSNRQSFAAFDRFRGREPLQPDLPFLDDPDRRIAGYGISVTSKSEPDTIRSERQNFARDLERLRQDRLRSGTKYHTQVDIEWAAQRESFIRAYHHYRPSAQRDNNSDLTAFAESAAFKDVPCLRIQVHLYASLLTRQRDREIPKGDLTDIKALSAYAPYMDVVCTDAFMAGQMSDFAKRYEFELFHAKTESLRELETFLTNYLQSVQPIWRPSITAFVLPPKERREDSFQFFKKLGAALRSMGTLEYGELFAFDDGAMPTYEFPQLPGQPVPFYGLQEVIVLPYRAGTTEGEILKVCRERCRSEHFVLIDDYKEIESTFMLGAAMAAEADRTTASHGYRIFRT